MNKAFTFLAILLMVGAMGCGVASAAPPLRIATSHITAPVMGKSYTYKLQASGGVAPYTWAVASGSLPPGLVLSSTGVISGKVAVSGSWEFTLRVTDSARNRSEAADETSR